MRYFLIVFSLLFSGCIRHVPTMISTTSIGDKYERPVQVVSGKSSAFYVLFFGPFGDNSYEAAIEDAKRNTAGDTLVNAYVDRTYGCFPIFPLCLITTSKTSIYGTLIRYVDENGKAIKTLPPRSERWIDYNGIVELENFFKEIKKGEKLKITTVSGKVVYGTFKKFEGNTVYLEKTDETNSYTSFYLKEIYYAESY